MEECCAVCAEPLEWVGYGLCGHQDVCSTCITRLRFVLNDRRCCICKQECPCVFVTKALGDFTILVSDFDSLAERGDLWYEANMQAYFDDEEHYRMIKAMCRLSCSICEQAEDAGKDFVKKGYVFRNLDLLRRHLLHAHRVQMCGLCLEGRKVFISEQKLYSRVQLDRHATRGDPEVDGNSQERGGFSGHPICDFCRRRFYGDNELYQHMSMDHYTCHICQRLRPGRYDYYRDYDGLEAHFRYEHALCEHPECLAKKFVVFVSDGELKRHNALSHGGNMSRSERNAALQIPVSFQYRRSGQDRGGNGPFRRRGSHLNGPLSVGAQANIGPNSTELVVNESTTSATDTALSLFDNSERNLSETSAMEDVGIESASSSSGNEPARYLTAVSGTGPSSLAESAFPPLPGSKNARRKTKQRTRGSVVSMAALLGGGGQRSLSTEQVRSRSFERESPRSQIAETGVSNVWSQALVLQNPGEDTESVRQSSSAVDNGNFQRPTIESVNDVMLAAGLSETNDFVQLSAEELRIANKALVDSIRSDLKGGEESFNAFKDISAQFRRGDINAKMYLKHITKFGLSHLVPELARLCPDSEKQKHLLEAYKKDPNNKQLNGSREALPALGESAILNSISGNGKDPVETVTPDETSIQSSVGTIPGLRLTDREGTHDDTDVEVLLKDGYRDVKGKKKLAEPSSLKSSSSPASLSLWKGKSVHSKPAKVLVKATQPPSLSSSSKSVTSTRIDRPWTCDICTLENKQGSSHCVACGVPSPILKLGTQVEAHGHEKGKKKASKAQQQLSDGSTTSLLDSGQNILRSGEEQSNLAPPVGRSAGRGVWKNGGGQRLVSLAQRESIIENAWNNK